MGPTPKGAVTGTNVVPVTHAGISTQATGPNDVKPSSCSGITVTAYVFGSGAITGTAGNDFVLGSTGLDTISGLGGNDCIVGGGGNDIIDGAWEPTSAWADRALTLF